LSTFGSFDLPGDDRGFHEGRVIWVVVNDAWLQLATGALLSMYIIGDLLAQT
jgi:hypothetical protein